MIQLLTTMDIDTVSVACAVILAISMSALLSMAATHIINNDGYRGCRRNTTMARWTGSVHQAATVKAMTTQRILAPGTDTGRHRMMAGR